MNFKKRVNGSWVDTPYYIHKTDTDTITTLPAVLYPTGTTATVGLKGNTLQSSTPSPTSPVMPQGTGDLETVGVKAGQYKIPILSANTTTPVYLGEVETTRKIKKLVLTGGEKNWIGHGTIRSWYQLTINDVIIDNLELCTHYKPSTHSAGDIENGEILAVKQSASAEGRIIVKDTNCATKADFLAFLASEYANGTPVTVWYILASETTGIVNEPLMKIGDYADEVSGITIPTIAGANTISVDTTLQPSEVTAMYKGWHPVQNVHERTNGAWT